MNPRFRDLPIRKKLLIMTLASSSAALMLASAGFLIWDVYQFRMEVIADLRTQARVVADNSSAPLNFSDEIVGRETLYVFELSPRIRMACLYSNREKKLFVAYEPVDDVTCPKMPPEQFEFTAEHLDVVAPVMDSQAQVGVLYVRRDLQDMYSRLRVAIGTVVGLLLLAIGAAFLSASRLQRVVVAPLMDLADTARTISTSRNYALRAGSGPNDEIGIVVDAFNDMLDQIDQRTSELSKSNAELEHEVQERRRVEAERSAALERERDANRLKDEFLATLSHELRTPLNAVLGWARVLQTTRVDPATQSRALESIERNARVQARLIEDLLEVSRIVTGKLRLQMREVDLAAIVDAAVEVVQPAAAAKRLRLSTRIDVRPSITAGDPDRLQQIVWNLLSNAVKFTPVDGQVSVTLERRDGYLLTVRDTGPGIEPKFLPFMFEPFRQADGSASREHGGLGLGLAIAKRLVELHGGTIHARSGGDGPGAAFEVHLPSAIAATGDVVTGSSAKSAAGGLVGSALLKGIRVLVVDDEEDARVLLETTLTTYGADVTTASNVVDALNEIDRLPPDVVLSDIGMPHEDGYALIRRLRERPAAEGGDIPAIALTAYASARDRNQVEVAGYQAHIAKPFEPAEVAHAVARLARATTRL